MLRVNSSCKSYMITFNRSMTGSGSFRFFTWSSKASSSFEMPLVASTRVFASMRRGATSGFS